MAYIGCMRIQIDLGELCVYCNANLLQCKYEIKEQFSVQLSARWCVGSCSGGRGGGSFLLHALPETHCHTKDYRLCRLENQNMSTRYPKVSWGISKSYMELTVQNISNIWISLTRYLDIYRMLYASWEWKFLIGRTNTYFLASWKKLTTMSGPPTCPQLLLEHLHCPSINLWSANRRPTTYIGMGRRWRPTSVPGRQRDPANGGPTWHARWVA